jgi:hypothetical protein
LTPFPVVLEAARRPRKGPLCPRKCSTVRCPNVGLPVTWRETSLAARQGPLHVRPAETRCAAVHANTCNWLALSVSTNDFFTDLLEGETIPADSKRRNQSGGLLGMPRRGFGRKLRRDRRKPAQRDSKDALVCGSELINRTEKLFDVPFNFICLLLHMFSGQVVTQYGFEIVELICDFTRNGFWEVFIISQC